MKKIVYIFMILLFGQLHAQENYKALWEKVTKLEKEGLTKSALTAVEEISTKATADQNHPQIIKAFLHQSKYALILEEDAELTIINNLKSEIASQTYPTKNILESILANLYWQYFEENRWKFYNRTETKEKVDANDFRTWDLNTLFKEIAIHFEASLENATQLQQADLNAFNAILHEQVNSKKFRPTVYDFLANNALQFYKTNEHSITKPANAFTLDNPDILCDAGTFATLTLTTEDDTSLTFKALQLYQELIRFHLNDDELFALADADIKRLKFVNANGTFDNKETLLLLAYENQRNSVSTHEVSGLYDYEIATIYHQQANKYLPDTKTESQWKNKEAVEICDAVLEKFPNSVGAEKCGILKERIEEPILQILAEAYVPIQEKTKVLITYKNLDDLAFKSYAISYKQYQKLQDTYREDERKAFIQKLEAQQQWSTSLKNEKDFQKHTTEVIVPPLKNGYHIITATANPKHANDFFAFAALQVTNMALLEKKAKDENIFQLLDRTHGAPITNQKVTVSYNKYRKRKVDSKTYTTDENGEISIRSKETLTNVNITVNTPSDNAHFGTFYIYDHNNNNSKIRTERATFLFTDRSIYRPGQTVHFKAILLEKTEEHSKILSNENIKFNLFDANHQKVGTVTTKTNEFGSVKGTFVLPNGGLTGSYTIRSSSKNNISGNTRISVEEYKRPKFETSFTPIKETVTVNEMVTAKGKATAFAGSAISEAKVVYRVHRKVQYPRWYYWYRPSFSSEPQEITNGETTTDASGNFEITFKAIPDESVKKENLPIFYYEVTAEVTDINGETRDAKTTIAVGYHSFTATIGVPNKINTSKKDEKITVKTTNLNGEAIAEKGSIKIYKLQAPQQVLRTRPWNAPDYKSIPEQEFKTTFPHEAYTNNTSDFKKWKKGNLVFETKFDTGKSTEIELGKIKKWDSGKYVIELTATDDKGQEVKDIQYTTAWNPKDDIAADNALLTAITNKNTYAPGDIVKLTFASATKVILTVSIEKEDNIVETRVITINKGKKTIEIPVTEKDLGGFAIHYHSAVFNSFRAHKLMIAVPYPSTELQIEASTFRDKLKPGQEEEWGFTIKGTKGEQVSAELLASMYDASLDEFTTHNWMFDPLAKPNYYSLIRTNSSASFNIKNFSSYHDVTQRYARTQEFDQLNWFGLYFGETGIQGFINTRAASAMHFKKAAIAGNAEMERGIVASQRKEYSADAIMELNDGDVDEAVAFRITDRTETSSFNVKGALTKKENDENFEGVQIRKNLQETAFFFPQLQTDADGNVRFSFTTPEALTQWKLQVLAHTKSLTSATKTLTAVTQKELMVLPNAPRFLREGDIITISSKIANLTEKALSGQAKLELYDAISNTPIDASLLANETAAIQGFSVDAKGNTQVSWTLNIPDTVQAVQYKIIAKAGDFSDGEQNALPVLSNRMLVTETMPMWIKSNETKTFTLDKLKNTTSSTLKHHNLSLEVTSNPAWYAVQALPYLMEYPYDCAEQTFSRYYANTLASHIANSNPRIQEVFNQWKNSDALLSNLEKNQELKSLLIQETPWLRDAQSETEQKKRIALLFDLNKMKNEQATALRKLKNVQFASGAFPWFKGGRENRFVTQHIATGFGHLKHLNVTANTKEREMILKAVSYLDGAFIKEYRDLKKYRKDVDLSKDRLTYSQIHYLYMRSFFPEVPRSSELQEITAYYKGQAQKYWLNKSLYAKGLLALALHRMDDTTTAKKIITSLDENSITSEELGMYWKENTASWFWYQAPIETQALLIEAFAEVDGTIDKIDNLKIWLLKNKQTNRWKTTKATTEAVYALLLQGSDWLSVTDMVDVTIGNEKLSPQTLENVKVEAGTGYFKTSWNGNEVEPKLAEVTLTKKGDGIAWGGLYWQYFEDLDKITTAETPLQLKKKLFLRTYDDTGEVLSEITENTVLKVGDLVRVRIELRTDRNMEFVHMKDMRAAGLEPVNVLSQYKWQDGLGYYESTKDASTNFFFDNLRKGIYVFEYDVRVNNAGEFSNGITTIQSMYAPEFSSHSEGVRITVK